MLRLLLQGRLSVKRRRFAATASRRWQSTEAADSSGSVVKVANRGVSAKEATSRGMQFERQRLLRKLGLATPAQPPVSSLPAQLLYQSKAGNLFHRFNAFMALGAFPVHAWGFYVLPDTTMLLYPVAFSLMYLWYSHRRATSSLTAVELQTGHRELRLETYDFFGRKRSRIVSRMLVAPIFVDASTTDLKELPAHLTANTNRQSTQDMQILAALMSEHRVGGLEVHSNGRKGVKRLDIDIKALTDPALILKLNQFARENAVLTSSEPST